MSKYEADGHCPFNSDAHVLYENPNVSANDKARFTALWQLIGPNWVFDKDEDDEICAPKEHEFGKMIFGENRNLSEVILTSVIKRYDFYKDQKIRIRQPMQKCGGQNLVDMVTYLAKAKNAQVVASGSNQILYGNYGVGWGSGAGNVQQTFTVILSDGEVEGELILSYWSSFNAILPVHTNDE